MKKLSFVFFVIGLGLFSYVYGGSWICTVAGAGKDSECWEK